MGSAGGTVAVSKLGAGGSAAAVDGGAASEGPFAAAAARDGAGRAGTGLEGAGDDDDGEEGAGDDDDGLGLAALASGDDDAVTAFVADGSSAGPRSDGARCASVATVPYTVSAATAASTASRPKGRRRLRRPRCLP